MSARVWDALARRKRTLEPVRRGERDPLQDPSKAQSQLWFLDRMGGGGHGYVECNGYWLRGDVDRDRFVAACGAVQRRHDALRTDFVEIDGELHRHVHSGLDVPFTFVELSDLPVSERLEQARERLRCEAQTPFDLEQAPLWRVSLLRLRPATHVLILATHHIVWDQWSLGVFLREVADHYNGVSRDHPHSYGDFVQWEQGRANEAASKTRALVNRLEGAPTELSLGVDGDFSEDNGNAGATQWVELGSPLSDAVDDLGRQLGATPLAVLAAGFAALLGRLSGEPDILVGVPVTHRDQSTTRNMIGLLTDTGVIRASVGTNATFASTVSGVLDQICAVIDQQDVSFSDAVAATSPIRAVGRNPLVQSMITVYPRKTGRLELDGVRSRELRFELGNARFDVELYLWRTRSGYTGKLVYRTDAIRPDDAAQWSAAYVALLAAAVVEPQTKLDALPLIAPTLLDESTHCLGTEQELGDTNLVSRFGSACMAWPDSMAVEHGDRRLSYARLAAEAAAVADRLRTEGVGCGDVVAIAQPKSVEFVVAMLGVLSTGAAYLPVDPSWPRRRLAQLLDDATVAVLVTASNAEGDLESLGRTVILLDQDRQAVDNTPDLPLRVPELARDALAYVMYTSGSTGNPKGVLVSHEAVVDLIHNPDYMQVGPGRRMAHIAPVFFDASTIELWAPLAHGGCIVIIDDNVLADPRRAAIDLPAHSLDAVSLIAPVFHTIARHSPGSFRGISDLLVGGDVVRPGAVKRVVAAGGVIRFGSSTGQRRP